MTLGMEPDRFLAAQRQLDGPARDVREERRLRLHRHVFLAAERAAVGDELHGELFLGDPEHACYLPPIVEDSLTLREEAEAAVGRRLGQRALRLQIQMFDSLRRPGAADDVRAGGEHSVRVAAPDHGVPQEICVRRIDLRRAGCERLDRVEHRREDVVLHVDERRGLARGAPIDGRYRRDDVADAPDFFAFGDEAGPVVVDQPVPALAGDVRGRDDRDDARVRSRARGVDAPHPGARVRRQQDGAVQQGRPRHVVDVQPIAHDELGRLIPHERRADAARVRPRRHRLAAPGSGHQLDGVDDLDVAGAPAKVDVDGARDFRAGGRGIAFDEVNRSERDARNAEAALHGGGGRERGRDEIAVGGGDAFEREDGLAGGLVGRNGAGDFRLSVDERQAAAALSLRLASVLERHDPAALPQRLEQRLAGPHVDLPRRAVQREFNPHGGPELRRS